MHRFTIYFLPLILLASLSGMSVAQPMLVVRDTTIQRNSLSAIPLYASVQHGRGDSVTLILRYNRYLLSLKNIIPSSQSILVSRFVEVPYVADSLMECTIVCEYTDTVTMTTPVVLLLIEPLAGVSDTTRITPIQLLKNNTKLDSVLYQSGRIRIAGTAPITAIETEYISAIAPNPTTSAIKFRYKTISRSDVSFTFFNAGGKEVYRVNLPQKDAGVYEFTDILNTIDFTSGLYLIRMQTGLGVYMQQFLMVK